MKQYKWRKRTRRNTLLLEAIKLNFQHFDGPIVMHYKHFNYVLLWRKVKASEFFMASSAYVSNRPGAHPRVCLVAE